MKKIGELKEHCATNCSENCEYDHNLKCITDAKFCKMEDCIEIVEETQEEKSSPANLQLYFSACDPRPTF